MALKYSYEKKEDISQGLESHYVEKDGKWVLDAEGVVSQEEHDRTKTAYQKRIDEAKAKATKGEVTEDGVRTLLKNTLIELGVVKGGDKGGAGTGDDKNKGGNESDLSRRLKALEDKDKTQSEELETAKANLAREKIHTQLLRAATAAGVRAESVELMVREASRFVELSDAGEVRTKAETSYGIDLTADQLIAKMKADPGYKMFWPESQGGGGRPGGGAPGGGAGDETNPWLVENWNITAQQRILGEDFEKGKRLAAAAKVGIYDNLAKARRAQQG